jgi:Protein of unknown function (DUF1365)
MWRGLDHGSFDLLGCRSVPLKHTSDPHVAAILQRVCGRMPSHSSPLPSTAAGGLVLPILLLVPFLYLFPFIRTSSAMYLCLNVIAWSLFWLLRRSRDPKFWQDFWLFAFWSAWMSRNLLWQVILSIKEHGTAAILIHRTAIELAIFTLGMFLVCQYLLPDRNVDRNEQAGEHGAARAHPLIHPARTTHTRMFPQRHSFSYSYLQMSVPIGFEGKCGSLVSVGEVSSRGWFHVRASDYLERTSAALTLEAKLREYLRSQVKHGIPYVEPRIAANKLKGCR